MSRQTSRAIAASISETSYHKAVHGERPPIGSQLSDDAVVGVTKARDGGPPERRSAGGAVCSADLRADEGEVGARTLTSPGPPARDTGNWASELGYQASEVMEMTGVTYRQLTYWDDTSLVSPSLSPAVGSGSRRLYSVRDLQFLMIARRLLDAGVSLQNVREQVDKLRECYPDDRPLPKWWSADLERGITITVSDLDVPPAATGGGR